MTGPSRVGFLKLGVLLLRMLFLYSNSSKPQRKKCAMNVGSTKILGTTHLEIWVCELDRCPHKYSAPTKHFISKLF
jgi:hypothetical protein